MSIAELINQIPIGCPVLRWNYRTKSGETLSERDRIVLIKFYRRFRFESEAELERKRGVMRERIGQKKIRKRARKVGVMDDGIITKDNSWSYLDPHLDSDKHEILTFLIQRRVRWKRRSWIIASVAGFAIGHYEDEIFAIFETLLSTIN